MADSKSNLAPVSAAGAVVGAMAVAAAGVSFTYTPSVPYGTLMSTQATMSPQDHVVFEAKIDAKVADLRGDIRLNTSGLADLKSRFDDLAKRMSDVPTNLATLTERVSHLPTKDELGTKLRNYLAVAGVAVAIVNGLVSWGPKLFGH